MTIRTTVSILGVFLVVAACSSDEGDGGNQGLPAAPVCVSDNAEPAPDFVGLTEDEALDLAEERGFEVREVGRDGECAAVTMDLRPERVNLEFFEDIVVGAGMY